MNDNPQLENGYTRIANALLEALIESDISGQELKMTLFVLRKTYGFQKKEDYISLSQFQAILKISKTRASQVVNQLQLRKILTVKENLNGLTKKYCFNKHFKEWTPLRKTLTVKEKRNQPLRKNVTTKETITKEIYIYAHFDEIWKKYPKPLGKKSALKHFKASVKTEQDWQNIQKALNNYIAYIEKEKIERRYIKHGSTWFNNWQDWIDFKEEERDKDAWRYR